MRVRHGRIETSQYACQIATRVALFLIPNSNSSYFNSLDSLRARAFLSFHNDANHGTSARRAQVHDPITPSGPIAPIASSPVAACRQQRRTECVALLTPTTPRSRPAWTARLPLSLSAC